MRRTEIHEKFNSKSKQGRFNVKRDGFSKFANAQQDLVGSLMENRLLPAEALRIADEERRRIGQDLHDCWGQELAGLALMAGTLADLLDEQSSPDVLLAVKIKTEIKRLLRCVRAQSCELIAETVGSDGLIRALKELAARVSEQTNIVCQFDGLESVSLESAATATQLYRIAQEAVTNAVKHAQASQISLRIHRDQDQLLLCVQDNGIGVHMQPSVRKGLGMQIMRSRADLIHAAFEVEQPEEGGVRIICRVNKDVS